MATVGLELDAASAHSLSTAFPGLVKNGTNFPVMGLAYDAASDEAAHWTFIADKYGSGNLTINVFWYAATATSGNIVWEAQIAAITADTDTTNIETDTLATLNTVTDSHLGTQGKRLHKAVITLGNLDSIAAGDWVTLRVARDANNASDTMTGDAILTKVQVTYSDA